MNEFYFGRVEEVDKRLEHLVESVQEAFGVSQPNTPALLTHKRKQSLTQMVVSRISTIVHSETPPSPPRKHVFFLADAPEEGGGSSTEDYEGLLKESDSIQRAMTDQYRTSKLLQNFAIMNYTGFVKIVKKYDKTFKECKGKYKAVTETSAVCNGGIDVEKLSDKMVRKKSRFTRRTHLLVLSWRCL